MGCHFAASKQRYLEGCLLGLEEVVLGPDDHRDLIHTQAVTGTPQKNQKSLLLHGLRFRADISSIEFKER
jgi:hypothetical protein